MKILAITNNKGGVGKTTTAINVAACLAEQGQRVLLVDLDEQSNLTFAMGVSAALPNHIGAFLLATAAQARKWDVLRVGPNLALIPSSERLDEYIPQLFAKKDYATLLGRRLADLPQGEYDYVVLDCPPNIIDGMTYGAFMAADGYLVPTDPEPFSIRGLKRIKERADKVRAKLNPRLQFLGFVFTRFNPNIKGQLRLQMVASVSDKYGEDTILPNIRQDAALSEAHTAKQSIFTYAPDSRGAADYKELTNAILLNF